MFWEVGGGSLGKRMYFQVAHSAEKYFTVLDFQVLRHCGQFYMMVLSRGPQWVCCARVCVVMEEHTAPGCYGFLCPLWQSWYRRLTVPTHLFLPCPFLDICNQYSLSMHYWSGHLTLHWWLCFTCWVRELANGCCSFVFKLFWIFSLEDLHDSRITTKRGAEGEGLKYNNFLLPKLSLKILPALAFLCHLTASSKFLQLSYFPAPEITVQPLNYWSANDLTVI